jgi:hypothetical protein
MPFVVTLPTKAGLRYSCPEKRSSVKFVQKAEKKMPFANASPTSTHPSA